MASLWQEAMEGNDQAHLAGLHAQAESQEAMYMMWEELDQYQQFRHALVGANPPVPSYPPQYMAPMFPEATTASVPFMGTEGSVWPGDTASSMEMMQWFQEDGGGVDLLPWCGDESQRVACYDHNLSHSRSTSSTESLPGVGGSEWGAETPELPTPPLLDHWRLPPIGPAPLYEPLVSDPIVPGGYSAPYVIKNTFIAEVEIEDEAETFVLKRRACSCPSSPAGRWGDDSFNVVLAAAQRLKKWRAPEQVADSEGSDHTPLVKEARMRWADHVVGTATPDAPAGRASPVHVLRLADVLGEPEPAVPAESAGELPSVGSAGHASGDCKPCAFAYTKGCRTGEDCKFCHLCQPGCARRRKKDWRASPPAPAARSGRRSSGSRAA